MLDLYIAFASILVVFIAFRRQLRKSYPFYLLLNISAIAGSVALEQPFIMLGFWLHTVYPQFFGLSLYALLMYIPWITLTFLISKRLSEKANIYLCYFLAGALLGLTIDIVSVNLGFYQYRFNSVFRILGTPAEITILEGLAMTAFLTLGGKIIPWLLKAGGKR